MSNDFGSDPQKMLDWDKKLGEQSDFVKKAIAPLLTWEFIDNNYNLNKNYDKTYLQNMYTHDALGLVFVNCDVSDLFDHLSVNNSFRGDEKPVVEKLKSFGIEGCVHENRVDIYDEDYLKKINIIHEKMNITNWKDTNEIPTFDEILGDYLQTNLIQENKNLSSYFIVGQPIDPKSDSNNITIMFFKDYEDIENHKPTFFVESNLDFHSSRKVVENTIEHFITLKDYTFGQMKEYMVKQIPEQIRIIDEYPQSSQTSYRQLETAQKTGYVQGVCESVLAFNTDENRKIMSEATMTFLSKKLLTEMNVTKDMAQKFANPETYKALEKCVFAPAQEQQLEQTQSQGMSR